MEQSKSINVRYSMLQGIYYVGFCAVIGYAAVYLGSIGMSSSLIGIVLCNRKYSNKYCTTHTWRICR